MSGAQEWVTHHREDALRASYTADLGQVVPSAVGPDIHFAAIHLERLEVVHRDHRQAFTMMGMQPDEFDAESAEGEVAMKSPWAVMNVGEHRCSMIPSSVQFFDPNIHVATPLDDLSAELSLHLSEARERLREEYLRYEHERLADLHASIAKHVGGDGRRFHIMAANAHHFAFKAADACAQAETDGTHNLLGAYASCAAVGLSLQGRPTVETEWLWHAVEVAAHRCIAKCKTCSAALPR